MQRRVIIYRDLLLPYSETFIPAQVESLTAYTGFYVGTSRTANAAALIPVDRSLTLSDRVASPAVWKMVLKLGGVVQSQWLRSLQELSAELIHAHFGIDGIWGLFLARKLGLPLVVTFHGNDATGMDRYSSGHVRVNPLDFLFQRGQFFRDLYVSRRGQLFAEATCVIAVSEFIREQLIQKGCPADKVTVHYIGVDINKFTPNPAIAREPIVLFVGRLVEKKGCEYLIRAIAQVQTILPDVELVVIGDGPLRSTLEQQAVSSLKHHRFLGAQSPEAVQGWMNRAAVFSVPSITARTGDAEGFGMVFAEAQAMELPVVSFATGGVPEAVAHGETGFLAPEGDWETLAKYLLTLLQEPQVRQNFAAAGRQRMIQHFNLKHNTAKLEAIYDSVLAKSG
ncbi:glycosyltransferase [Trichocoleus sp. FACHB-262]|uniref:glycosyltransferase n=1 Tax=Trichocoleus sp. FACHB-262 TaxID=2692869 RepID=UPI001689CB7E|nr:glycosyltransferase [Trichocoleus sp. FACHB-262]MBD2119888.1 glycosyltransferase [Trichocoleus sp. FACHB-262]